MEQNQNPTTQPTDPTPPPPPPTPTPPPPQPLPSLPPPSSSTATPGIPSPNPSPTPSPNPTPKPSLNSPPPQQPQQQQQQTSQTRPPFNRTWPQQSNFPQFSSAASTPSVPANPSPPQPQRGGMAIGVPAHHPGPSPSPPTGSFSSLSASPFGQQFGGLGRNASESMGTSQARQSMQGVHGMGMMSSPLGSGSQMRPSGISGQHPQRPQQSSLRPQMASSNPSAAPQSFTGHGLLRVPGSVGTPSPSPSQGPQYNNQPWLSSGSQGKPPLPSPLYRSQINTQQRSHISQQHNHPLSASKQQQPMTSVQRPQQSLPSHIPPEQFGQQHPPSRAPQSLPHQQQAMRGQVSGNQKSSTSGMVQASPVQIGPNNRPDSTEATEAGGKIVSKRSIHDLVTQIDPSEMLELDPEVEDILVDIAEDFVDTITTFGCSLANHRKSNILEAKDILLHLERNWNLTLPGFGGDEIKTYKRPAVNDIHRERLGAIKKSMIGTDFANTKNPAGQSAANTKVHIVKASANAVSQDT